MIATGTVCLIVWSNNHPEVLGHECTVVGHETIWCGIRNLVELKDGTTAIGPDRCFLPLKPLAPEGLAPIQEHFQR